MRPCKFPAAGIPGDWRVHLTACSNSTYPPFSWRNGSSPLSLRLTWSDQLWWCSLTSRAAAEAAAAGTCVEMLLEFRTLFSLFFDYATEKYTNTRPMCIKARLTIL